MGHAEALLLVHDQEPKVLEDDILLQQLVGAHDQIHRARPQALDGPPLLGRGPEPGEDLDVHREALEPPGGGHIVLLSQNRGGHQDGHLLGVQHGLHGGPEGHLGFAEAHVAAEQPVHGGGGFHVPLDLRDAAELIVGLGIGEVVLKLPLPGGIGGKGKAHAALALGVELDQPLGQVLDRGLGLLFGLFPAVAAQLVQLDRGVLGGADVFIDQVHLGGRHIEHVRPLIGDFYVVLDGPVHLHLLHAHVAADAVVLVDDQIPGAQVREGAELLPVGGLDLGLGGPAGGFGQELALGEHRQLQRGILHAGGQTAVRQIHRARLRELLRREGHGDRDSLLPQKLLQQLPPAAVAAEHQGPIAVFAVMGQVCGGDLQIAAVGGQLLGHHVQQGRRLHALRVGRRQKGVQKQGRMGLQLLAHLLPVLHEVAELSRQDAALQEAVQLEAHILHPGSSRPAQVPVVAEDQHPVGGHVVRRCGELWIDQTHVPVIGPEEALVFDLFQIRFQGLDQALVFDLPALLPGQQPGDVLPQALHALGVQGRQRLRHRQQHGPLQIVGPALGQRVEGPHGVQLVAEELRPDRGVHGRAVYVQDPAPERKLAHALHHLAAGIARPQQTGAERLQVVLLPPGQLHRSGSKGAFRQGTQGQGLPGGEQQLGLPVGKGPKGPQPPLLPLAGGGGGVVEGQIPARQDRIFLPQKGGQLLLGPPGSQIILADHQQRGPQIPGQPRDQMGPVDLRRPGNANVPVFPEGASDRFVFRKISQSVEQQIHRVLLIH